MSFFKDTIITSGSRVISLALTVGVASASARLLGPEGRGELAIYTVLGLLLALASSSGVEMAGAYYAGVRKHPATEVMTGVMFVIGVSTLIAAVVGYLLWIYQIGFAEKISAKGLIITILYVPAVLFFQSIWYLNSSFGYTKYFSLGNILTAGLRLIGILLLCWWTATAENAMLAFVISGFTAGLIMLILLGRKEKIFAFNFSWQCIKDLYTYGIRYYFARMAQFLNVQIGTMVIAIVGSTAHTGFFAAAISLVAKLTILPEILSAVLLSRVVKRQRSSLELIARTVRTTFWAILFASILVAALCKPLVWILFSAKFFPIIVPIWILLPGMLIRCCSKTLGVYFNGIGRPGVNSIAIVSAVATNITLMYILLPIYGVSGAAIAATLGYIIDGTVLIIFYKFVLKHSLLLLIPRFSDVNSLLVVLLNRRPNWLRKSEKEIQT